MNSCAVHIHFMFLISSPVGAEPVVVVGVCQNQDLGAPQPQPCPSGTVSVARGTEAPESPVGPFCASFPLVASLPLGPSWGEGVTPSQRFLFLCIKSII